MSIIAAFLVGKTTVRAQKKWVDAVETRVSATATILKSTKAVKMTGLADFVIPFLQGLRVEELNRSKHFRKATTARNAISMSTAIVLRLSVLTALFRQLLFIYVTSSDREYINLRKRNKRILILSII